MNKITRNINSWLAASAIAVMAVGAMTSCDDKLDIVPKGKTVLDNTSDLELLLNNTWDLGNIRRLSLTCNECYTSENVNLVREKNYTVDYALLTYDESVDRAAVTSTDEIYENGYADINYANTVLTKVDDAQGGTEAQKTQIKAEAHVLRAYLHFILVNIYAAQYDESTATDKGGIPYSEDIEVTQTKQKLTIAQDYEKILADCDDAYINALPDNAKEIRGSKAWGNAVRAKVLMQMKRYGEALPYALKALEYNGNIEDRTSVIESGEWNVDEIMDNNIFYMPNGMGMPWSEVVSCETKDKFENGDITINYALDYGDPIWNSSYGPMDSGVDGTLECTSFTLNWNNWGITADRMYYTAAECYIRTGQIQKGLDLVNKVRKYRIDPAVYADFTASTEEEAMTMLQKAKWIECIATYENFFDCKRWNTESKYMKTITRTMPLTSGETISYSIKPDSKLWIFPFPANATRYNSTLTQNYEQ